VIVGGKNRPAGPDHLVGPTGLIDERNKNMTQNNRVLSRVGARELTVEEVEQVAGSLAAHTNVCSLATTTVTGDGDACHDMDHT
jgi:hypothetical protein